MKNLNLKNLIQNLCLGSYSQAELIQLISLMQKISLSFLKYQEITGKRISIVEANSHSELQDLALDCIADLFMTNGCGKLPQLERYYGSKLGDPGLDDTEILILTRRLVVRKTKQELSRIFRERDPEGAKIVRNIKVAIRNSDTLASFREFGKDYVYLSANKNGNSHNGNGWNDELRKNFPAMPEDFLESEFLEVHNTSDPITVSVRKILTIIGEFNQYQNYLPIEVISRIIRNLRSERFRDSIIAHQTLFSPMEELQLKEIDEHVNRVMEYVSVKINSQYLSTGKISAEKAAIYQQALKDVLYDLLQRRNGSSYFRHLKSYIPQLTQKQYRDQERSVFEYLAKIAKREFRKKLTQLL